MIEIILLVIATGAIASLARRRGGNPWVWGPAAVVGYVVTAFCTGFVLGMLKTNEPIVPAIAAWLWMGAVAVFLRFGLGSQLAQPDTDWFCTNCKTYNKKSAAMCEACRETWESQQQAKVQAAAAGTTQPPSA